jgi:hypothetical protein
MHKRVSQKVSEAKLLAQIAMGVGGEDKNWNRTISALWNEYLRGVYYKEHEHKNLELDMQQEYKKFSHLRPKMVIQKDGSLQVVGLPKLCKY